MNLITGEHFEYKNAALVEEFNELTYQLNKELYRFSEDEILSKYNRIKELNFLLGISKCTQLKLF